MFIVSFLKGDNEEFSSMYKIWAQSFHKNNNFNLRCTFCEKKALHIKNIRAPNFDVDKGLTADVTTYAKCMLPHPLWLCLYRE